eukprot:1829587-Alexandrium_andersonii.AAC.1
MGGRTDTLLREMFRGPPRRNGLRRCWHAAPPEALRDPEGRPLSDTHHVAPVVYAGDHRGPERMGFASSFEHAVEGVAA